MSEASISNAPAAPNAKRLLWAGFMAILAAGVGMGIRNGILDNWAKEFGFTGAQLGEIGGAGFSGFCFGIILGGVVVDKLGYGKLVIAAFVLHILSAIVAFGAVGASPQTAYYALFWGMFIFAFANGNLEAVANPLVATLFPNNRTHFLNLLHASWPIGLALGTAVGWVLDDKMQMDWKLQLAIYLVPTVIYGAMFFGQKMPKSEASEKGMGLGEMFKDVGILGALVVCYLLSRFLGDVLKPVIGDAAGTTGWVIGAALLIAVGAITRGSIGSILLFALFIAHALVGAVELGTDSWISNITGNLFTSEQGKFLFIWTSLIMFGLRFCADFIEKKMGLSPIGILLVTSILACIGLNLASGIESFGVALLALGVYAVGKTFFWPTMLAVASDRFPRTGAVAISIMGGIGALSAGMIGTPGLGYCKDRFAAEDLKATDPAVYEASKAEKPSTFLNYEFTSVHAIDGKKLAEAREASPRTPDQEKLIQADRRGDRKTLRVDSFIPVVMALIYLAILLYFKSIGGYKAVHLAGTSAAAAGGREEQPETAKVS